MKTKDLDYFCALVENRNYTMVAQQFLVSQPAITQAIQRLEREFDAKLVVQDRVHQQTKITRLGLLLYKNAKLIMHQINVTHREIDNAKQVKIKFGLPPILGRICFPKVAGELLQKGLLQQLDIIENGSNQLTKDVENGDVDIALLASTLPIQNDKLDAIQLDTRPFSIVVSPASALANLKQVSFQELAEQKFISLTEKYIHHRAFMNYCSYTDVKPAIIYRTPDISWIKGLIAANLGVAFLVKDVINEHDGLICLEITDHILDAFNISLVMRAGYIPSDLEMEVINCLLKLKVVHK